MLTFEKVLTVFGDYLQQDSLYEVVLTKHGYTLMAWEPARSTWYSAEYMATPELLLDSLLDAYTSFMEDRITDNERDLTKQETDSVNTAESTNGALPGSMRGRSSGTLFLHGAGRRRKRKRNVRQEVCPLRTSSNGFGSRDLFNRCDRRANVRNGRSTDGRQQKTRYGTA